jgi:hypothetical protein
MLREEGYPNDINDDPCGINDIKVGDKVPPAAAAAVGAAIGGGGAEGGRC